MALNIEEEKELKVLRDLQARGDRFFTQEEFDRLKYLWTKKFENVSPHDSGELEIVIFEKDRWDDIPEQDNPFWNYKEDESERVGQCIMVCKSSKGYEDMIGFKAYTVYHIPLNGHAIICANCRDLDMAKGIATHLSKTIK